MERMDDFFTARIDAYEHQMLHNVEGCREAYVEIARLLPDNCRDLLDLGCGTGLELDEIFRRLPSLRATGIDLTAVMLDKLRRKHPDKQLHLICGSYFDVDFGVASYDCAVSCETMHHFTHERKIGLYARIRDALRHGGCYIECDYMLTDEDEERRLFAENDRIRSEMGIPEGDFYHFDTPCTIDNQLAMFSKAGFASAAHIFRIGNTSIIVAQK